MFQASSLFRLLGDDVRLRILRLLETERLNVSELTSILGIAQSGVSRHLGLLREAGLVREHREGGYSYYDAAVGPEGQFNTVWPVARAQLEAQSVGDGASAGTRLLQDDDARLAEVRRQREEHRATHGAAGSGTGRQLVPGRSWVAWSRALGLLLSEPVVVDLGCGDGYLTLEMAVWARRVIGVDRSADVLRHARALSRRRRVKNVEWKRGTLERIPLPSGSADVAVLSHALHHVADPRQALAEAARLVVDGGRVLVLDLDAHDQSWVRDRLDDRWLGFDRFTLARLMEQVGLRDVRVEPGVTDPPFRVVVAVGSRRPPTEAREHD